MFDPDIGQMEIERICHDAWHNGTIHRRETVDFDVGRYDYIDWEPYEDFMQAKVVRREIGEVGELIVDFPCFATDDNYLHVHATSARVLTVIEGSGIFVAERNAVLGMVALTPGSVIFMPPNIKHTFVSGLNGMLLRSIHAPYQGLIGPEVIQRTEEQIDLQGLIHGQFQLPKLID